MTSICTEIQRHGVTIGEFLRYIDKMLSKKGLERGFSREELVSPAREYSTSYTVVDGEKICHFVEIDGAKSRHWSSTEDGGDAPCEAETYRQFAYDFQVYSKNWDGSCYNEICEFTFDGNQRGTGYYYQASLAAESEEAPK
jgi:hypothetical protein